MMSQPTGEFDPRILVVDDEPANVTLVERLLTAWGYSQVRTTTESSTVPDLFTSWRPDLLMLDLAMPVLDGFDILEILAPTNRGALKAPILVLTADVTAETKRRALAEGATDFVTKPFDVDEVRLRVANLLETRRLAIDLATEKEHLEMRVRARTLDLEHSRLEILHRLAMATEYHDDESLEHTRRVGATAGQLAELLGVAASEVRETRLGAALHDVGKVALPHELLAKPGRLTPLEFETIKTHTTVGSRLLRGSASTLLERAEVIARTHHERWDGRGYPARLARDDIPLPGRLVAVADVFDTLTHERPYRAAMSVDEAVAEIRDQSGRAFDPAAVRAFEALDHTRLLVAHEGL